MGSAALVLLLVLASQDEPSGLPREPAVHLQAAAVLAVQPAGPPFHRFHPPLSGDAAALLVGVGFRVAPALAIEGELVTTRTVSAPQRFSYNWIDDYTAMSRDLLCNALVRWTTGRSRSLHFVGGAGVARSTIGRSEVTTRSPFFPERPPVRGPGWSQTSLGFTLTGGVDLDLKVHPRLALVPTFRTRLINRTKIEPAMYLGVGSTTYHVGFGLRARL